MYFDTYPWKTNDKTITYTFSEGGAYVHPWLLKAGYKFPFVNHGRYEITLDHGTILFFQDKAYLEGEFSEEELYKWEEKFKAWNAVYDNKFEFMAQELREIDNEIFFNFFDHAAEVLLSEALDYLPALEAKGLVFDFRNLSENDNPEEFVLEDADSVIMILSLNQRRKERQSESIVYGLCLKTENVVAQDWLSTIYLGHLVRERHNENEINHILDYFNSSDVDNTQVNATSYPEMLKRAEKWIVDFNKKINTKVGREDKDHRTLYSTKNNYTLLKLLSENAKKMEGKEMSNCIGLYHLQNDHIYSIRIGDKRVASLDIRQEGDTYSSQEIKGFDNKAVPKEHWPDVRECLNEFFKLDYDKSNDLHNIGLKKYEIAKGVSLVLEMDVNLPPHLFAAHYFSPSELQARKESALPLLEEKHHALVEEGFEKAKENLVLSPYTKVYLTVNEFQSLKDMEDELSKEEIQKLSVLALEGRRFINSRDYEGLGLKKTQLNFLGLDFLATYPLSVDLKSFVSGIYYTEEEIREKKEMIVSQMRNRNSRMKNSIEAHFETYIEKFLRCPYTKVLLTKEEFSLVNRIRELDEENPAMLTSFLFSEEGSSLVCFQRYYLENHTSFTKDLNLFKKKVEKYLTYTFSSEEKNKLEIKEGQSLEEVDIKQKDKRSFLHKVAKVFGLETHPAFFQFLTKNSPLVSYKKPVFKHLRDVGRFLIPPYSKLASFQETVNDMRDNFPSSVDEQNSFPNLEGIDSCPYCANSDILEEQEEIVDEIDGALGSLNDYIKEYNDILRDLDDEINNCEYCFSELYERIAKLLNNHLNLETRDVKQVDLDSLRNILSCISKDVAELKEIATREAKSKDKLDEKVSEASRLERNITDQISEVEGLISSLSSLTGVKCQGDEETGEDACDGEKVIDKNSSLSLKLVDPGFSSYRNPLSDIPALADEVADIADSIDEKEFIRETMDYIKKLIN